MSLVTWVQSSRVGTTISACGVPSPGSSARWSIGTPKARVFPVPVLAWPMTSSPASASGSVSCWIGKAWVMPASSSAWVIAGSTPSSANVGAAGSGGADACRGWGAGWAFSAPVSLWSIRTSSGEPVSAEAEGPGVSVSLFVVRVIASLVPARTAVAGRSTTVTTRERRARRCPAREGRGFSARTLCTWRRGRHSSGVHPVAPPLVNAAARGTGWLAVRDDRHMHHRQVTPRGQPTPVRRTRVLVASLTGPPSGGRGPPRGWESGDPATRLRDHDHV